MASFSTLRPPPCLRNWNIASARNPLECIPSSLPCHLPIPETIIFGPPPPFFPSYPLTFLTLPRLRGYFHSATWCRHGSPCVPGFVDWAERVGNQMVGLSSSDWAVQRCAPTCCLDPHHKYPKSGIQTLYRIVAASRSEQAFKAVYRQMREEHV